MTHQIEDIVKANLCVGCGACVSESESSTMLWSKDGFLIPEVNNYFNDLAIKVCPFNPDPDNEVKDEDKLAEIFLKNVPEFHPEIGQYAKIYIGYVPKFRLTSSSGGFGTYFFEQLLSRKIVDHVFTVVEKDGIYAYNWVNNAAEIRKVSKTRYFPVTLEQLFKEINEVEGKVAVSAIPSFVKAIRLKQYYYPKLKEKILFIEGIICGGIKSLFFTEYLAQKAGIACKYSRQEYRIKDLESSAIDYSFGAFDEKRNFHSIKMRKIGDTWGTGLFNANAYDFSTDVTAELADVSLGDAWIDPYRKDGAGHNVIVTRSEIAQLIVREGIRNGDICAEEISIEMFCKSQAGGIRHMQKSIRFRLRKQKARYGLVPHIRRRMCMKIPFEFKMVQHFRMALREKSLNEWKRNPDCAVFDRSIQNKKTKLKFSTRVYHRMQRIRKMLGWKTI